MGWADSHIARLVRGETVQFRLGERALVVDDIVLCRVKGNQYLHLVKAIQGERFQIGNNRGGINGWITRRQIYGWLVAPTRWLPETVGQATTDRLEWSIRARDLLGRTYASLRVDYDFDCMWRHR
jgi:hypothetical protein